MARQQSTTVGEICNRFRGEVQTGPFGSQLHSSDYSPDGTPVVMPQDMLDGRVTTTRIARVDASHAKRLRQHALRRGDIAFSRRGDVARFAVITEAEEGWLCGTGSIRIRLNCPEIDVGYLRRYLNQPSVGAWLEHNATGVTMPNLNTTIVRALPLAYPPLPEQRRIAAILDQADALRAKRREALAQLDSLTQSIFIEMFGDPVLNPMHWPMRAFGQICETRLGKMLDQKQQTGEHPRPYLRNANVQWHRFDLSDVSEMDFDERARSIFRLHPGDLLICEGGEPGRAAIWNGEISECYYQKALHRARPNRSAAIAAYLAWLLWFLSKGGGLGDHVTAATIAHLTGEKLQAMSVMVPPVALQQTFASRIEAVESLKATHRTALAELDALFASLQHRAFAGQLS